MKDSSGVLILGAGPAGMSAAFALHKAKTSCAVVEKNDCVGGLSRTLRYGDFSTDIGGHRFFSQNKFLYEMIRGLLGGGFKRVDRLSRFYVDGEFFLYPVNLKEVLAKMGSRRVSKIIFHYLYQKVKKKVSRGYPSSFEEKVIADFGRELAQFLMLDYTEKIWGMPCKEISSDWVSQRIKNLSLREVIRHGIKKRSNAPKSFVSQFYYPDEGIGSICEAMKDKVFGDNQNLLMVESYPVRLAHEAGVIKEVIVRGGQGLNAFHPREVISSIPLTELVCLLEPRPPQEILRRSSLLQFRSHLSLLVTLNKPAASANQWLYFPEKRVPFGRIMEPKNWSRKLAPVHKTSLLIEFFSWEGDHLWKKEACALLAMAEPFLEEIGFARKNEVLNCYLHRERDAYPVYDVHYKEHLQAVKKYFAHFKNLQLIGRGGRFRYNNMDHAMETGVMAARNIVEGHRYDLEQVAEAKEYFERGYVE